MTAFAQLRLDPDLRRVDIATLRAVPGQPTVGVAAADLGEHPVWSAHRDGLVWVDIDAGRVLLTSAAGLTSELFVSAGTVGAALPLANGDLIVLAAEGVILLPADDEPARQIGPPPREGLRFNDAGIDPAGRVWAGVLPLVEAADSEEPAGELWRLSQDGSWQVVLTAMGCPNGIVWSPDGRQLLFCESDSRRLARADVDPATGDASNWRICWEFTGDGDWVPDGLEWLPDGSLWVAFWGLGAAAKFDQDGRVEQVLSTDDERTTSVGSSPVGIWVTAAAGLNRLPVEAG